MKGSEEGSWEELWIEAESGISSNCQKTEDLKFQGKLLQLLPKVPIFFLFGMQ